MVPAMRRSSNLSAKARSADLGSTCGPELAERLEQDRIQPVGRGTLAGEPLHPDPVGRQQMIKSHWYGFEEGAAIGAILFV